MRTAWTAWTTSGGRTSPSSPTLRAGGSKPPRPARHCHLRAVTGHDSWPSQQPTLSQPQECLHTVARPALTLVASHPPRTHTLPHSCFCMELSLSKVSRCYCCCPSLIATVRRDSQSSEVMSPLLFMCAPTVTFWTLVFVCP